MFKGLVVVKGNPKDDLYGKKGVIVATKTRFYGEPDKLNEHTVCKILIGDFISKWINIVCLERTMEMQ